MRFLILAQAVLILYLLIKMFIYYCAIRGVLYYLGMTYDDLLDDKKVKELTQMSIKRTTDEFFDRN